MMCVQFSLKALLYGMGSNITASDIGSLPVFDMKRCSSEYERACSTLNEVGMGMGMEMG